MIKLRNESLSYIDLTRHLPDLRASISPVSKSPRLQVSKSGPHPDTENGHEFTAGATRIFVLFLVFFILCLGGYYLAQ